MIELRFTERIHKENGWEYNTITVNSSISGRLPTEQAPVVGDLVYLNMNSYIVIQRAFSWPIYGSLSWPHTTIVCPKQEIDILIERSFGLFIHEAIPLTSSD